MIVKTQENAMVNINGKDFALFDVCTPPFSVHGVFYENGKFRRLPESVAKEVSSGVHVLHSVTAGGRVKFRTNALSVGFVFEIEPYQLSTMPLSSASGFEIFADGKYEKTVFVSLDTKKQLDEVETMKATVQFSKKKMREITVYFPLYCRVRKVEIGLESGSEVLPSADYAKQAPIVYYGSSITQGCCASKSSCIYPAFIERWTHTDFWNLGFAGNCRGEERMREYLATLPMSVFVLDYDYNAPTPEHLLETHVEVYKAVRQTHKDIPIIMLSKPLPKRDATSMRCYEIIKATYEYALSQGDTNVCLIDGHTLFGKKDADVCTVDGCHPTDLGFYKMAKKVYAALRTFHRR